MNKALYSGLGAVNIDGKQANRLMIVLYANGCEYALKGKGPCINCGFSTTTAGAKNEKVSIDDYIRQFKDALKGYDLKGQSIREIDIYVSGSFLNDHEVQPEARDEIYRILAQYSCIDKILVESRPEYITPEKIKRAKEILSGKELEIAIGLESASDDIKRKCINKGFTNKDFEKAVGILAEQDVSLLTYVLVKPAYLSEREAIEDSIDTAKYVFKLGEELGIKAKVKYEVTFVQPNTAVYGLYKKGKFQPAWLWSIIEIIKNTHYLGDIAIGTSEDEPMPIAIRMNRTPSGEKCRCTGDIERLIEQYNLDGDLQRLLSNLPECECKKLWREVLQSLRNISNR